LKFGAKHLQITNIGIEGNFFDLGGHSMLDLSTYAQLGYPLRESNHSY